MIRQNARRSLLKFSGLFERKPQSITPQKIPLVFDPGQLLAVRGRTLIFESGIFDLNKLELRPAFEGMPAGLTEAASTVSPGTVPQRTLFPYDDNSILEYATFGEDKNFITGLWQISEKDQHSKLVLPLSEFRLIDFAQGMEPGIYAAIVTKDRGVVVTKFTFDPFTATDLFQHLDEGPTYFNPKSNTVLIARMISRGFGGSSCWQINAYTDDARTDAISFGNTLGISQIVDLGSARALLYDWNTGVYLCLDTAEWPTKVAFRVEVGRSKAAEDGQIVGGAATENNEVVLLESQRQLLVFKYADKRVDVARVRLNINDEDNVEKMCGFDTATKSFAYDATSGIFFIKQEGLYRIPVGELRKLVSDDC
jgi:hypothetical protein